MFKFIVLQLHITNQDSSLGILLKGGKSVEIAEAREFWRVFWCLSVGDSPVLVDSDALKVVRLCNGCCELRSDVDKHYS